MRSRGPVLEHFLPSCEGEVGGDDGGLLAARLQDDGHLHVVVHHGVRHPVHVVEEVAVRLHEGQVVLVAEQVCPPPLAVASYSRT